MEIGPVKNLFSGLSFQVELEPYNEVTQPVYQVHRCGMVWERWLLQRELIARLVAAIKLVKRTGTLRS